MIRDALDRMALGELATLAGVDIERVDGGWKVFGVVHGREEIALALEPGRSRERLLAGAPGTEARIAELRRQHGRALRVTGQARAKRARWTKQEAWLVVSYPKEA